MEQDEIESYLKAGNIARKVREYAFEMIKPNMKLIEIALEIDEKIYELGGEPAFPVNLSMNEIAAHYTPELNDETIAQGILKVDLGVSIDGYIADTAFSVDLTEDNEFKKIIELNKKILEEIEGVIKPDMEVCDVGKKAQEVLRDYNMNNKTDFSIIKSLSGHELGKDKIHAGLVIPNYENDNKTKLNEVAFAIEPFVTNGFGEIYEGKGGGIYSLNSERPVRDRASREILNFIKENYKTRPFCLRWLEKKGFKQIRFVISNLVKQKIIHQYPLLIEKNKAPVSQFEHTFLLCEGKVYNTTKNKN